MKGHPHQKHDAMKQFHENHHETKYDCLAAADGKYTMGEMDNPKHLERSVKELADYAKKNKMKY